MGKLITQTVGHTQATRDKLGVVKIGNGLNIDDSGTASLDVDYIPAAKDEDINAVFENKSSN